MTESSKILFLRVGYDDGTLAPHFGIVHEGKLWLVTTWLIDRTTQLAVPERMIRVDTYRASRDDPGSPFDFSNIRLPRAVIEGRTQDSHGYEVRSLPDWPRVHRRDLKMLPSVI